MEELIKYFHSFQVSIFFLFFWLKSHLSDSPETKHTAMTNKSLHLP